MIFKFLKIHLFRKERGRGSEVHLLLPTPMRKMQRRKQASLSVPAHRVSHDGPRVVALQVSLGEKGKQNMVCLSHTVWQLNGIRTRVHVNMDDLESVLCVIKPTVRKNHGLTL